ncbi:MAG TPA: tRNA (adenosine(37)-N6)-dimethylallyltransferase MiaA [Alphaproteobacteria bacterium]|nr:tRNA (adenosine(37)-N6)-dimethylallyltransferase MiaA [Alphaproteobacteria bacterium]
MNTDAVLIAGPTASGKSALGVALAQALGGAVINADSMQVYKELRVVSARPSEAEMQGVPHFIYGTVAAWQPYSAGRWLDAARLALTVCRSQGLRPIFVGGTGLYFSALTQGLAPIPDIHAQLRVEVRQLHQDLGPERFHALLAERDPVMAARLGVNDGQRLIRAYEVFEATGVSLAEWQEIKGEPLIPEWSGAYVIKPNREWLYHRIDTRFDQMMEQGALEEVRALIAMRVAPDQPVLRALGVPQLSAHLRGEMGLDEAVAAAKMQTRRYAKRQMTWFRHQMTDWTVVEGQVAEQMYAQIVRQLEMV